MYEVHLTIEPVFDEELECVTEIAKDYGFKVAELLLKKNREATPERSRYDTFMTGHFEKYIDAFTAGKFCRDDLIENGFPVWRFKIENIVFDERY